MLSLRDVKNRTFEKAGFRGGYSTEDVDAFCQEVEESIETFASENDKLRAAKERLQSENQDLKQALQEKASALESLQRESSAIQAALITAEKLRESAAREGRRQAELLLSDAQAKAERIVNEAQDQIFAEKNRLEAIKREVSTFRSSLLHMYKQHLRLITDLPQYTESKEPQPLQPDAAPAADAAATVPAPSQPTPAQPEEEPAVVEMEMQSFADTTIEPPLDSAPVPGPAPAIPTADPARTEPEQPAAIGLKVDENEFVLEEDDPAAIFGGKV